jgi:Tfp pilus assembly protein PilE
MSKQRIHSQAGFTLIEVGIASLVLVVGFIGMIRAMTFTAGLMDHARRQTVAAQILTNEIEQLRLESWATISLLPTSTTWASGSPYVKGAIVSYQGGWFSCVTAHTSSAINLPPQSTLWAADMTWRSSTAYQKADLVMSSGTWYRCLVANTGSTPTSSNANWATYAGPIANTGIVNGATYTVSRCATDPVSGSLREITVVVTWSVTTSRRNADDTPLVFYYSRVSSAFFGKNGLNLSYQRS